MEVPVTVSNNKFRGRGKSISGMVDRTLNLYQDTSTTQNSETKNILSQPKYGIESKSSTTATDDQQAPIHNIVRPYLMKPGPSNRKTDRQLVPVVKA